MGFVLSRHNSQTPVNDSAAAEARVAAWDAKAEAHAAAEAAAIAEAARPGDDDGGDGGGEPPRRVHAWNVEYTAALRELHGCVWHAYASLDESAAAAALAHRLPIPYPISARLYSLLLLATFGDDGMPLPSTQAVVQLLARVRRRFGLSVQCHVVCLAEATYAMHRRLPDTVDLAAALLRRVEQLPPPPQLAASRRPSTTPTEMGGSGGGSSVPTLPSPGISTSAVEAYAIREVSRGMREHFARALGDLHSSMSAAPAALLQHLLDAYVHLYSAHVQQPHHGNVWSGYPWGLASLDGSARPSPSLSATQEGHGRAWKGMEGHGRSPSLSFTHRSRATSAASSTGVPTALSLPAQMAASSSSVPTALSLPAQMRVATSAALAPSAAAAPAVGAPLALGLAAVNDATPCTSRTVSQPATPPPPAVVPPPAPSFAPQPLPPPAPFSSIFSQHAPADESEPPAPADATVITSDAIAITSDDKRGEKPPIEATPTEADSSTAASTAAAAAADPPEAAEPAEPSPAEGDKGGEGGEGGEGGDGPPGGATDDGIATATEESKGAAGAWRTWSAGIQSLFGGKPHANEATPNPAELSTEALPGAVALADPPEAVEPTEPGVTEVGEGGEGAGDGAGDGASAGGGTGTGGGGEGGGESISEGGVKEEVGAWRTWSMGVHASLSAWWRSKPRPSVTEAAGAPGASAASSETEHASRPPSRGTTPNPHGIPPHLLRPLPLWAHTGSLEGASAGLSGPPPPVLDEVRRLYKSSIKRCWVDLCGRAYSGKPLVKAVTATAGDDEGGADASAADATLDLDQLLVLAQSTSQKLEIEARRFHPVFAQYAPSIAEFAAEEWGHLFINDQLVPSLRAHCACAKTPDARVAALAHFLPLWRVMTRMNAKHGPLWSAALLAPALAHVQPLVEAWIDHERRSIDVSLAHLLRTERNGEWAPANPTAGVWHAASLDALIDVLRASVQSFQRLRLPTPLVHACLPRLARHMDETLLTFARETRTGLPAPTEVRACALRRTAGAETTTAGTSGTEDGGGPNGGSSARGWGLSGWWRGTAAPSAQEAELFESLGTYPLQPILVRALSLLHAAERLSSLEALLTPLLPTGGLLPPTPQLNAAGDAAVSSAASSEMAGATGGSGIGGGSATAGATAEASSRAVIGPSPTPMCDGSGADTDASEGVALFGRARPALLRGTRRLCELIGCKIVLVEARMHERLYMPSVADAPLRAHLQDVNVALGAVVRSTPLSIPPLVPRGMSSSPDLPWCHVAGTEHAACRPARGGRACHPQRGMHGH